MSSTSKKISGNAYSYSAGVDSKDLSKVLIGALAGAAAGVIISGLSTKKGIEVRNQISESSKSISNNLKDKVSDAAEEIADKYEALKESAANLIEKGKQKISLSSSHTASKKVTGTEAGNTGSKVLLGALAASVVSSIIWSFASEKGIETRKKLGKSSKKMTTSLKDKFSNIADGIVEVYDAAKEGAADLMEKAKQQAEMPSGGTAYKSSAAANSWEG